MDSKWPAVALLALALVSCSDGTGPRGAPEEITDLPRALTSPEVGTIASANGFGFELLKRLYANPQSGQANVFISPISASMVLGMALNGAANDTHDAIVGTLGLSGLTEDEVNASYSGLVDLLLGLDATVDVGLANSAWLDLGIAFLPDYLTRVRDVFGATVENLDLQSPEALTAINDWAAQATHDRIREVVTPDDLTDDVIAVLANALYFKGMWRTRFDPSKTVTAAFQRADESTVDVPMMHGEEIDDLVKLGSGPGYRALDLPYGGAAFSMTVVLPTSGASLDDLVAETSGQWWDELLFGLHDGGIGVWLPRFQIEYEAELNDPLTDMGMGIAFSDMADFSRMVDAQALLSSVKQKTFVKVDEEGTEAAAVTTGTVGVTSAPQDFRVDRPFLFAIRERLSGTILFVGAITDPTVD